MKVHEFEDGAVERKVLIGMIVNDLVAARAASAWKGGMFKSRVSNLIGKWCVNHFLKYGKPIGKAIELKVEKMRRSRVDSATAEQVETFLAGLNREYESLNEDINAQHLIDEMGDLWNKASLEKTAQAILDACQAGELDKAKEAHERHHRVEIGTSADFSLFQDKERLMESFAQDTECLIEYKGPIGKFFRNTFKRGNFVSFMAPEKSSKSFWLEDVGYRAMRQRKRVGFIQAGDMSLADVELRFAARAASHPTYNPEGDEWPYVVKVPVSIEPPDMDAEEFDRVPVIEYEERTFEKKLTPAKAWKAYQNVVANVVKSNKPYFMFSENSNDSVTIEDVRNKLLEWKRVDFEPDVLVIDYADVMAFSSSSKNDQQRDKINKLWSNMRKLANDLNILIVTASQTNRDSYTRYHLNRTHISEDKRKLSHCTDVIVISCTPKEKAAGACRLSNTGSRKSSFLSTTYCYVVGCLAFSNPCVKSCFLGVGQSKKRG